MTTNSIVHFIGFVTRLEADKFIPAWEQYAKKEMFRKKAPQHTLHLHTRQRAFRPRLHFRPQLLSSFSQTHRSPTSAHLRAL